MIDCAHCSRPLICDHCDTPYRPETQEQYEALHRPEVPVFCNECERAVVCHWCKAVYDGLTADDLMTE